MLARTLKVEGLVVMPAYELREPLRVCALTDRDALSLAKSASGGAFAVIARSVISCGGVVYGAALEDDGTVHHVRVSELDGLERLQGSKYVWSSVGECYRSCVADLRSGRSVLFTGVPCQIASLEAHTARSGLSREERGRLLTCDLICHGTPKPELFKAYLSWLADRVDADDGIHGYRFRTKRYGWGLYYYYYYYYRGGKKHEAIGGAGDDPYYHAFSRGVIYRRGCYSCAFARRKRLGDFTIGDFWGVRKRLPPAYDRNGVSALLINTENALRYFDEHVASECICHDATMDMVCAQQTNLDHPTVRTKEDEMVASEVDEALARGEFKRIFEELLPIDRGRNARLRRHLPAPLLRVLYRFRNAG